MPFTHTLRPRYAEVDMQKVVFNGHWLTYFDDACTRFFESLGFDPRETFSEKGLFDAMVVKAAPGSSAPSRTSHPRLAETPCRPLRSGRPRR
jgi:acyl-CoA thioester hydrolase